MNSSVLLEKAETAKRLRIQLRDVKTGLWWDDPCRWVADILPNVSLSDYQADELTQLATKRKVAVRGPRGSGKTMPASIAFWWFATTRELAGADWKVPSTAGSAHQVGLYLWPEIHRWYREIDWGRLGLTQPKLGRQLLTTHLKMDYGEGFGRATDDPALIEGAHASNILMIIDEGKSVVDGIWDAVEGFFSNPGNHYAIALSTPGAPAGRFYEIHSQSPGYEEWHPIHVTIEQAVAAGRVDAGWVEKRRLQWGENSQLYRSQVLAEFAGEEDGIIPLAWVEAAMNRWDEQNLEGFKASVVGVDVADTGADDTVLALRNGWTVGEIIYYTSGDVLLTADRVQRKAPQARAVVDSIGLGAGTLAALQRAKVKADGFVASGRTKRRDKTGEFGFLNIRAAAWWNLRELLDPADGEPVALPRDDRLLGDLTAPRWREAAGGKIQVESKADIKKRLGRSTDSADAVVQAFWEEKTRRPLDGWTNDLSKESAWNV